MLCHGFGVRVSAESGRNSISANAFCNTYIGKGALKRTIREHKNLMQIDTGAGLVIEGASDLAITGNTFTGLDTEAVKASSGSKKLLITNNILTECARRLPADTKWINIGDTTESLVKDNLGAN